MKIESNMEDKKAPHKNAVAKAACGNHDWGLLELTEQMTPKEAMDLIVRLILKSVDACEWRKISDTRAERDGPHYTDRSSFFGYWQLVVVEVLEKEQEQNIGLSIMQKRFELIGWITEVLRASYHLKCKFEPDTLSVMVDGLIESIKKYPCAQDSAIIWHKLLGLERIRTSHFGSHKIFDQEVLVDCLERAFSNHHTPYNEIVFWLLEETGKMVKLYPWLRQLKVNIQAFSSSLKLQKMKFVK